MNKPYIDNLLGKVFLAHSNVDVNIITGGSISTVCAHKIQMNAFDGFFTIRDSDPKSNVFTKHQISYNYINNIEVTGSSVNIQMVDGQITI